MPTPEIIVQKLTAALTPAEIEVLDESDQHIGHAGARVGGNSHFYVKAVSSKFIGLSSVERHKFIYKILADEMQSGIHALRILALIPGEN